MEGNRYKKRTSCIFTASDSSAKVLVGQEALTKMARKLLCSISTKLGIGSNMSLPFFWEDIFFAEGAHLPRSQKGVEVCLCLVGKAHRCHAQLHLLQGPGVFEAHIKGHVAYLQ